MAGSGTPTTVNTTRPRAARSPMVKHPWRVVIVVGTLLVVVNLGFLLLNRADTDSASERLYPTAIDGVTPAPGELIRREDTITADLRDGLTGVLVIDGAEVPLDQLEFVKPLGQISFRPGPDKDLQHWEPGAHTAAVLFWPIGKERPARPGSYAWSFRAGA